MPSIITVGQPPDDSSDHPSSLPSGTPPAASLPKSIVADPAPKPVTMRAFGDAAATREAIYNNILESASAVPPVTNGRYTLELHNPHWMDHPDVSLADRKKAVLRGESLHRRLAATWRLKDKDGNLVDERKTTIAHVPKMTNQGTFVMNGTEHTLGHQMRLRSGVYTRQKESGELESHFNVAPGKGLSHRYFLEPSTGLFKLQVGQASMPLISVLKAMGATDNELKQAWGDQLHGVNNQKDSPRTIDKLYERLMGKKGNAKASLADKSQAIRDAFAKMELDPEVTKRTLGHPHSRITKEAALATTRKLLAVNRGEAETDDRDSLAYQHFLGPEDLFAERIGRDKRVLHELLWKSSTKGNLEKIPTGAFTKHVHAALLDSGLGQPGEEANPIDIFDHQGRTTRLGYGGIPSAESVPDDARMVHPSQVNFVDLLRTAESGAVGIDTRVSHAAKKGSDGKLYSPFIDIKTGKQTYLSPQDIADRKVAFPNELQQRKPLVAAMVKGRATYIPREEVELEMPHAENWFSPLNNMVPMKSGIKGQRAAMASRFLTQALPLQDAESAFVSGQVPGQPGKSFDEHYGPQAGAVRAESQPGRVVRVDPDGITVKYADGTTKTHETYNMMPYNRKTFIHNTPVVNPGDVVKPGDLLAKSNTTDNEGRVALGKNFRVAYTSFRGLNYEDALVISSSAAKRLTSEHMYQNELEWDPRHRKGLNQFVSIFPGAFEKKQLKSLDSEGIIKPGSVVRPGDPLILAARERELSHKQVHASHKGSFTDESVKWDHHNEGIVTDVAKTDKGVNVVVKSHHPMQVGDKLSGRYGNKGVVADIIPDHQMPQDEQGRPFELLANPLGIISRYNPAQMVEATLGAIAEKTGKRYTLNDFADIDSLVEFAINERKKHGVNNYSAITDPTTGQKIPNVFTGNSYFLKLHHMSEHKNQGRGIGGYSADESPSRGSGPTGSAKKMALMNVNALMSHNAIETLRDSKLVLGQKNQEYWSNYMQGNRPPTPKEPLVYRKFLNQLKASGINVRREGNKTHLMEMTNKDIKELTGDRELENVDTVDWKSTMAPIKGGLFDERLTGGHTGDSRWARITLHEPMPNPVMEDSIRRLLGLTQNKFEGVLAGREELHGKTGPQAISTALHSINIPKALDQAKADIKSGKKMLRDNAVKRLQILKGAETKGIHPKEWMLDAVPVIPPIFRPVSVMQQTGGRLVNDANHLYKEVFDANQALKKMSTVQEDVGDERLNVYNAFKAVTGLGDPIQPKHQEKNIKGFLRQVFNDSPKYSIVQQKLIGTPVDLVGRAVVTPNPDLDMDQVGLPEPKAWEVYKPFITRRLVKRGVPRVQALEYIENRHELAKKAMLDEIAERPIVVTRAPVLHRYGQMAFWPQLTKGDTLQISPLVTSGFGMDFDGNCIGFKERVELTLTKSLLMSKLGVEFFTLLQETIMRLSGSVKVQWTDANNFTVCLPIGEFPRAGKARITSKGQKVFKVPDGVQIVTYDYTTASTRLSPITHFTVDSNHPCVLVRTARDRTVEVSDNESLCRFDNITGEMIKDTPQNSIGHLIPYVKRDIITGQRYDRDLGWWYGVLVADGWITSRTVGYAKNDKDRRERFVELARKYFDAPFVVAEFIEEKTPSKFSNSAKVHLNSFPVEQVLDIYADRNGDTTSRSALFKKLPDDILHNGSREALLGLLAGVLDGDSSVTWNTVKSKRRFACRLNTSSVSLMETIQLLLRKLGVRSSCTIMPATAQSKQAYIVCPSVIDMYTLLPELELFGQENRKIVNEFISGDPPGRAIGETIDPVPITVEMANASAKIARLSGKNTLYGALREAAKTGRVSRYSARQFIELVGRDHNSKDAWKQFVARVDNEDVHWDIVESIESIPSQDVFDFVVPDTKVYAIANGLVVYDTSNYHVPAGDEAREEAIEKMMPSKNLLNVQKFQAHYTPTQEYIGGLYNATAKKQDKKPRVFATRQDVIRALHRHDITPDHPVQILDSKRIVN
jgi:DNA-directed RNA polymerase subunit beta